MSAGVNSTGALNSYAIPLTGGYDLDAGASRTGLRPWGGNGNMLEAGNFNFVQAYTTANQLSGWSYDASGDLLIDGQNNGYAYDAEGRISGVGTYSGSYGSYTFNPAYNYVYDAGGNRVAK